MNRINLFDKISEKKIIPVIKLDRTSDAKPLGEALCTGGLLVAEVTFRTDAAEASIKIMKNEYPEMMVGAGTVTNVEQATRAQDAGAAFLVSPGISRPVIEFAIKNKVPVFPGTCTPSEIMIAMEYGLSIVKFFPAEQYEGLNTIKALAAPFPTIKFMPTGGINSSNILDFLDFDRVIACGGSWMVKDCYIREGKFDETTNLTAEAVALVNKI